MEHSFFIRCLYQLYQSMFLKDKKLNIKKSFLKDREQAKEHRDRENFFVWSFEFMSLDKL